MSRATTREHAADGAPAAGFDRFTAILVAGIVAALAVFGFILATVSPAPPEVGEGATVLPQPKPLPELSLVDQDGERFDRSRLEGRWSLLFFGYTYCPDVCPFVLQELERVMEVWRRTPDTPHPQVVFVSVDPERDTPERLAEYVRFFDPAFVGVSGDPDEIERLTGAVGAFYQARDGEDVGLVDHASKLFLIDPDARWIAVLDDPHEPVPFTRLVARVQATREDR